MPRRLTSEIPELPEYGLRTIFGDTVRARILDFLTLYRNFAYSMSEIARNSHVSWRSFNREFDTLVNLGLVKEVDQVGRAKLYQYASSGNVMAECLVKVANEVALQAAKKTSLQAKSIPTSTITLVKEWNMRSINPKTRPIPTSAPTEEITQPV